MSIVNKQKHSETSSKVFLYYKQYPTAQSIILGVPFLLSEPWYRQFYNAQPDGI